MQKLSLSLVSREVTSDQAFQEAVRFICRIECLEPILQRLVGGTEAFLDLRDLVGPARYVVVCTVRIDDCQSASLIVEVAKVRLLPR